VCGEEGAFWLDEATGQRTMVARTVVRTRVVRRIASLLEEVYGKNSRVRRATTSLPWLLTGEAGQRISRLVFRIA
jgi:hypothetical protein